MKETHLSSDITSVAHKSHKGVVIFLRDYETPDDLCKTTAQTFNGVRKLLAICGTGFDDHQSSNCPGAMGCERPKLVAPELLDKPP